MSCNYGDTHSACCWKTIHLQALVKVHRVSEVRKMKKIAMALLLVGGIAAAGQANAQGWRGGYGGGYYHGGGGGYAGAAIVGAVAGLLVGTAVVANSAPPPQQVVYAAPPVYAQPVYAQPVYAQPVYAQPQACYDPYSRAYVPCGPGPGYVQRPGW
jgi:hypothetical protein